MKAIEILKYNKNIMIKFINSFDDDCKEDDEYISGNKYIEELNEAIKELEELNNKSCEGCIYNTYAFENEQCTYCSRRCVDFYEAKGE